MKNQGACYGHSLAACIDFDDDDDDDESSLSRKCAYYESMGFVPTTSTTQDKPMATENDHNHDDPIEKFACKVCCQTYGMSDDDIIAGFIDIAAIISTITQIIEMIRNCNNQAIERRAGRRRGRRLLVNRIATEYLRNCRACDQFTTSEDCEDIANQMLDNWLALDSDERNELIPRLNKDVKVEPAIGFVRSETEYDG